MRIDWVPVFLNFNFGISHFSVRLNERNGDLGKGILEIYKVQMKKWVPACVQHWNPSTSPASVCSMLGYSSVNSSKLTMRDTNLTLSPSATSKDETAIWRMYQRKRSNLIKEFASCPNDNHPVVELTCSNYGKIFELSLLSFCPNRFEFYRMREGKKSTGSGKDTYCRWFRIVAG